MGLLDLFLSPFRFWRKFRKGRWIYSAPESDDTSGFSGSGARWQRNPAEHISAPLAEEFWY